MMQRRWRRAAVYSLILNIILAALLVVIIKIPAGSVDKSEIVELALVTDIKNMPAGGAGSRPQTSGGAVIGSNSRQAHTASSTAVRAGRQTTSQPNSSAVTSPVNGVADGNSSSSNGDGVNGAASGGEGGGSGDGDGDGDGAGAGSGDAAGSGNALVQPPVLLKSVQPSYPTAARRDGIEGTVVVRILILTDGRPGDVSIVSSSGDSRLDEAATAAVWKWRFVPAINGNGNSMDSYSTVPIQFSLQQSSRW